MFGESGQNSGADGGCFRDGLVVAPLPCQIDRAVEGAALRLQSPLEAWIQIQLLTLLLIISENTSCRL